MEKYQRLRSGDPLKQGIGMRSGMSMIELIFAIVVIAISILSIPSMMAVADQASKRAIVDEDVMSRLTGWTLDKFQARWDGNYSASGSGPLWLNDPSGTDLECNRGSGNVWYRFNPDSMIQCSDTNATPSAIPATAGSGAGQADGNLSRGIEQLNGGSEPIQIQAASGETYNVTASYAVSYVDSKLDPGSVVGNSATATWRVGSSGNPMPDGSLGTALSDRTHLKRVVTTFSNSSIDVNMTLTFFKSNKGN